MARSRNIKPSFFENDDLADIEPLGRLLFIGLWTIADFKGELEYRPKRIKAQILPYDNCDIEEIVTNLDQSRFITIYNVEGVSYIHINKFTTHQNPHPNEKKKGSNIPSYTKESSQVIDLKEVAINRDKSRQNQDDSITDPADSCFPLTDSLSKKSKPKKAAAFVRPSLEEVNSFILEQNYTVDPQRFVNHYSSNGWKVGKNSMKDWKAAVRSWQSREKENEANNKSSKSQESMLGAVSDTSW